VDGVDVARDPIAVKRRIAVVPQVRNLDRDLTCREVLTFHGRYFGLAAREREERADGLQQRLLVARALMHDPKVLLLDEPTIGLDPQARRLLWDTLRELHEQGLTLIMTTHYMEEADRLCQRVAIIDHGKILTLDTPAALKQALPGGQILDLWLRGPSPLEPRLSQVQGVLRVEALPGNGMEDEGERLRLFVTDGVLDSVLQEARSGGADVRHVSMQPPSLEDVYIHLTGRELRE
jgi:ABC-2 type transport system ATP-binding protein